MKKSEKILVALAYASMCLIWGSTWMVIKIGLRGAPPLTAVGIRFGVAALLITTLVVLRGMRVPWGRHFLGLCVFLGLFHMALPYVLVYWAEQHITSGLTAVLYSTMPLMVAVLAHFAVGERLTWVKFVGIGLGILGVWIIFADSVRMSGSHAALGVTAVLGSVAFASMSSVMVKKHGRRYNPMVLLFLPFWIGGAVALAFALPLERSNPIHYDTQTWMTILYLAVAGSVIAFTLLFWVIQRIDITVVSYQTFVIPILALVLGWVFLDETISARVGFGSLFVLAGIGFATFRRRGVVETSVPRQPEPAPGCN